MNYHTRFHNDRARGTNVLSVYNTLSEIKGTRVNRSFVPWYAGNNNEYLFWKRAEYSNHFPTYSTFFNVLSRVFLYSKAISYKCRYKNIPEFRIRVANGIVFEWNNGFPKIHFLVTKNTGINPYQTEEVRYYISEEFFTSEKFKYIYKQVKKKILVPDEEATIVVHSDILPLFYDKIELPKFDNLIKRIEYEENILDTLVESNTDGE